VTLTGRRFGRLTVVAAAGHPRIRGEISRAWLCHCDCGAEGIWTSRQLLSCGTRSCGCLISDAARQHSTKHGHIVAQRKTPSYQSWTSMNTRCFNSNHTNYKDYGGRGITVCERWCRSNPQGFSNFLFDMGARPKGTTLDRFPNNDGNYEQGNCRWATRKEQASNQRPLASQRPRSGRPKKKAA